jgi:LPXTG-site transpeptidase (sortase) family protein
LTGVSVTDPMLANLDCDGGAGAPYVTTGLTVNIGTSLTCVGTYVVTQADIDGGGPLNNTVTGDTSETVSQTATESVTVTQTPDLTLAKSLTGNADEDGSGTVSLNDTLTFTITLTNTGNTTLTNVVVSDPLLTPNSQTCASVLPGNTCVLTGTYVVTQADVDAGQFQNTAAGTDDDVCPAAGVATCESTVITTVPQTPDLTIVKTETSAGPYVLGNTITYSIVVTNTGDVTLHNVNVTDNSAALGACVPAIPVANLIPGAVITCSASHVVLLADITAGVYSNTATVTDNDLCPAAGASVCSSTVTVPFALADLSLTKVVNNLTPSFGTDITFTISVTNSGPDPATGVLVTDQLPSGYAYVSHLASQGTYNSGTGLWNINNLAVNQTVSLQITATVLVTGSYVNTAEITAANEFDPDSTPGNNDPNEDDQASVSVTPSQNDLHGLTKALTDSSQEFTLGANMAIGEIATYQVSVNVPPGIFPSATLVDTLGQGLAYVDCISIDAPGLSTDVDGFTAVCSGAGTSIYPVGSTNPTDVDRQVTYDFGTLTNTNLTDRTLTVTYRAVVLNTPGNQDGVPLTNSAVFGWATSSLGPVFDTVNIVEPDLAISKTANLSFVTIGSEVTFTLTIKHTAVSSTNAFDVVLLDVLPAELQYVAGSLDCTLGVQDPDVDCSESAGTIRAEWSVFARNGGSGIIRFRTTVLSFPAVGGINNAANVSWSSLPGDVTTAQTENIFSTERYYDPASGVNVYGAQDVLVLLPLSSKDNAIIPVTGFAPGHVTNLSNLHHTTYTTIGRSTLEIPKLNLTMLIVGVPFKDGGWDVNWLTGQVGWLEQTAFPGFSGNSVLTSHVTSAYGVDGPFANLKRLVVGDLIKLRANGNVYTYLVSSTSPVGPNDLSVFRHETKSWLTLVTCAQFDEVTQTYSKRLVVRAVLVDTQPDTLAGP